MSDKLNSSANVVSVGVSGGTGHHGYTEEETEAFTYVNHPPNIF